MPYLALRGSTRGLAGVCSSSQSQIHTLSHILDALDDHFFDALTARTCNGHPLPCPSTNASVCVTDADAVSVFAIGGFEYECVFPCLLSPSITHARQLYLAHRPKCINVYFTHIRYAHLLFYLRN